MKSKLSSTLFVLSALASSAASANCLPGTVPDGNGNCGPAPIAYPGPSEIPPPEVPMDPTVGMQITGIVIEGHIAYRPTADCSHIRIWYRDWDQQNIFIANKDGKPMVCGKRSFYLGQIVGSTSFEMFDARDVIEVVSDPSLPGGGTGTGTGGSGSGPTGNGN